MDTLVRQYERPVFNAAYRMLGNVDDAADVTQTTFIKAFEHIDSFKPRYRFFSWIYRIAVNESINQIKRRKPHESLTDAQASPSPKPDELAATSQVSEEVQMALLALQESHRSVLVLKYFTGCSYREIGEILEIPEKTVKSRLFSARQQLKDQLEQRGVLST
ncbi:MAG: sigma-70 family RNA polymerase sigma factor [Gammaproteobacteria bacterium]|nr:sigma-70 family RNA polymerase sigma factor [Gammaproteobacteria bacterium]NNM21774.1 sigma-70 family RNA polymerase sigma factor [Gammaproteobacteria bacterium]